MSKFYPDTRNLVKCIDCRFFIPQLDLFSKSVAGHCHNIFRFKKAPHYKRNNIICDAANTCCGCSLPNTLMKFNEKKYFSQDNTDFEYENRRMTRGLKIQE